jgi:hypothetical protein
MRITLNVKVKRELSLQLNEYVCGTGGTAPRILNLRARCRRDVSFTPRPLYPWEMSCRNPFDRGWAGPRADPENVKELRNLPPFNGTRGFHVCKSPQTYPESDESTPHLQPMFL